jgi:aspartate racemase
VVVTSIAGHFCINTFKAVAPLPVIDLIEQVDHEIAARGLHRIGVLGTRTVMETGIYGRIKAAALVAPTGVELDAVHAAYVAMAAAGAVTDEQRAVFHSAAQRLITEGGAEAILLGGTDLALVFSDSDTAVPIVNCAAIHADAVVRQAVAQV